MFQFLKNKFTHKDVVARQAAHDLATVVQDMSHSMKEIIRIVNRQAEHMAMVEMRELHLIRHFGLQFVEGKVVKGKYVGSHFEKTKKK